MVDEQPAITLYRLQAYPFCERVVRTLDEQSLAYQLRSIEPVHSGWNVVKRVSGKCSVSAIVDDNTGVTVSEPVNIIDYLEHTHGEGA